MTKNKVDAPIIGADGNIFNILAICQRELRKNGRIKDATEISSKVMKSSSYDEALNIIMDYVNPISCDEMSIDDKSNFNI